MIFETVGTHRQPFPRMPAALSELEDELGALRRAGPWAPRRAATATALHRAVREALDQ